MKLARQTTGSSRSATIATMAAVLLSLATTASGAPPWGTPQMQPGIAMVTCIGYQGDIPSSAYTLGLMDLRNPDPADYGSQTPTAALASTIPLWRPDCHHEASWTAENLGMLFGTEIDADGDMYAAAGGLYPKSSFYRQYGALGGGATDLSAAGTISTLDRITGMPTVFSVLPQKATNLGGGFISGPGVGNIAYDADFDQFFATNMEDGMIYRIPAVGGPPVGTPFDPLTPDSGAPGMPPVHERLWGISVHDKKVYYAVWNTGITADPGKIRRVDLDATGAILPGTDTEILTVPGSSTFISAGGASLPPGGGGDWWAVYAPVGDIEISADGQTMILAQRGQSDIWGYVATANHAGKVFIARLSGGSWSVTNTLESGNSWAHGETYGGADFGVEGGIQEKLIWCSSADLVHGPGPHGIQGTRPDDFPVVSAIADNCYKVPYNPAHDHNGPDTKGIGGDIDIMQDSRCVEIDFDETIEWPEEEGAPFSLDLTLTNLSGQTVKYLRLTPCPTPDLPPGAVTGQPLTGPPLTDDVIEIPGAGIPHGGTYPQTIYLPGWAAGEKFCFRLTLLNSTGEECCTEKFCIDLPACDCLEVIEQSVTCELLPNGLVKYTIELTIRNLTDFNGNPGFSIGHATFLPPSGFVDATVEPSPNPIPPGGIGTVEACYIGLPGTLCVNFAVHDPDLVECCSQEICIELPDCTPGPHLPDACKLDKLVPCCPGADGTTPVAMVNYTICNNSSVPRTYSWSASSNLVPPCTEVLPTSAFSPSGGTIGPVPPGGCVTIPIQITCEHFKPGDCAAYVICATFDPDFGPLCCRGKVYAPEEGAVVIKVKHPDDPLEVPLGGSEETELLIENTGAAPVVANLVISDTVGILGIGRQNRHSSYHISIPLDPGEVYPLDLLLTRFDDGHNTPDFTSLMVHLRHDAEPAGFTLEHLLSVSVRLSREGEVPFGIRAIAIVTDPEPLVEITVATQLGRIYRVRESADLVKWTDTTCSVLDGVVNPDGTFNGTGGEVVCGVPCEINDPRRFYIVIETP
ncbi:MAG: hypothetical protein QF405_14720 [Roseibacillus sp.]|nr:hypothetical protein [Roseibacillus sp.]